MLIKCVSYIKYIEDFNKAQRVNFIITFELK